MADGTGSGPTLDLKHLLQAGRVLTFREAPSKRDLLQRLCEVTASAFFADADRFAFTKAIFDREDVACTALGGGIAIPHARLPELPGCILSIALVPGGCDYGARDGQPVRVAVMIAARDRDRSEHLRVLAAVASRLRDGARVQRMLDAADASGALAAFLA